ncbi:hypothetical protein GCM10009696_00580 [Kocuria himachalensis]
MRKSAASAALSRVAPTGVAAPATAAEVAVPATTTTQHSDDDNSEMGL